MNVSSISPRPPCLSAHHVEEIGVDSQPAINLYCFVTLQRSTHPHPKPLFLPPHFLQWAGHPIANDPCYGGELYFGDAEAKLRAEANSSTEGWKGTSRSKAAAAAAAAAAATAAEAAAAMAAAAAAIPIGGPDSESSELVKINGGETRTTVGVDAAAPIVDKATEGKGGGGGEGAGQDEGGGPEGSASGASRDKPSTEAEEMVAGGEDIEVQRDGEDDEAYMVGGTQHVPSVYRYCKVADIAKDGTERWRRAQNM